MELPVLHHGEVIGSCLVRPLGLYWELHCRCRLLSDRVERLYWREHRLGVLEREKDELVLRRTLSQSSLPGFPEDALYLQPPVQVLDCQLPPTLQQDGKLWYPCEPSLPFPCLPLACFFRQERKNGKLYWTLALETL